MSSPLLSDAGRASETHSTKSSQIHQDNSWHSPLLPLHDMGDILQVELGPPFLADDFQSGFHSRSSSPIFSDQERTSQHATSSAACSLKSHSTTSQSDLVESDQGYETDTEAQHIFIYPGHRLYKHSSSSDIFDLSSSDDPDTSSDFADEKPPAMIGGQKPTARMGDVVLDVFVEELRRMIPSGDNFEFDVTFLEKMDSRLLLTPMDVFDELCWTEISQSLYSPPSSESIPDLPFEFPEESVDLVEEWYKNTPQIVHRTKVSARRTASLPRYVYLDARRYSPYH